MSYCEIPEFYSESAHVAKKAHKCCECRLPINAGERYVACRGKYDGDFFEEKQHVRCYHFARWVNYGEPNARENSDSCVPFGEIKWHLQDCGDLVCDNEIEMAASPLGEMWLKVVKGEDCAPRLGLEWLGDATAQKYGGA